MKIIRSDMLSYCRQGSFQTGVLECCFSTTNAGEKELLDMNFLLVRKEGVHNKSKLFSDKNTNLAGAKFRRKYYYLTEWYRHYPAKVGSFQVW